MRREDCDRTWVWKQGVEHVKETQFMKMKWNCIRQRNAIYENGLAYARETQFIKMDWKLEYERGQSES